MKQDAIGFDLGGECFVRITPNDSGFTLSWHDGVANEWEEHFSNLSQVFARVAALAKCGEQNWGAGFVHQSDDFVAVTDVFFSEVVE